MATISEKEAALLYVRISYQEAINGIHDSLGTMMDTYKPNFIVESTEYAAQHLALARISLAFPQLDNLYEAPESERLKELILSSVMDITGDEQGIAEVKHYYELWSQALSSEEMPWDVIAHRLLRVWLKGNLKHYVVEVGGGKYIMPMLIQSMSLAILKYSYTNYWKEIKPRLNS